MKNIILTLKKVDWLVVIVLVNFVLLILSKQEWWVICLCISLLCSGFLWGARYHEEHLSTKKEAEEQQGQQAEIKNGCRQGTNATISVSYGSIFQEN